MLRTCVLVLAIVSLIGCGGGTMPFTPPHSGSSGGTSSTGSGSGSSSSGSSGSGTSSSGSSGSGTSDQRIVRQRHFGQRISGSGTSGSGSSGTGTSTSGSSGSGTSAAAPPAVALPSSGSSGSGTSTGGSSGSGTSGSGIAPAVAHPGSGSSGSGTSTQRFFRQRHLHQRYADRHVLWVTGPSQFTFGGYTWETHSGSAPPVGNANGNVGKFDPNNVIGWIRTGFVAHPDSERQPDFSSGAEVMTKQTFTYGTFEFTSRVVDVLSGSVMTGFLYASNSITEIDMEQVGNKPDAVDCTNWQGSRISRTREVTGYDQGNSHDFKIVWQPGYVDWYVDGRLVVHHTQAVPSAAAPFLFSAWGTNKSSLGRHGDHRTDPVHVHQQLQVHAVNIG